MPLETFTYKIKLPSGEIQEGEIQAESKEEARERLAKRPGEVLEVLGELELSWSEFFNKENRKINAKDLFLFTKYFGVLLKAGIPVTKCLEILEGQIANLRFKKRIKKIRSEIEAGVSIAEAFGRFPDIFNNMYVNLLRTGEESGLLYEIFQKLTLFLQKSLALRNKVKSAMIYPVAIALVATGVVTFLLAFIIPRFEKIFKSFKAELPLPTKIMLSISYGIRHYSLYGVAAIVVLLWIFFKYRATESGRRTTDGIILKLPLFGALTERYAATRFCSNLSLLLRSGVAITKALDVCKDAIENVIIREEIEKAAEEIASGKSIKDAFMDVIHMPPLAKQMIAVGDETGNLEDMLQNASEFYEEEVEGLVEAITSLIEPMFILFLGIVVGGIVISMFFPMFQMGKVVQGKK